VDGGTHLSGFRSALTRSINNFASSTGMLKEQKDELRSPATMCEKGWCGGLREAAAAAVRRPDQENSTSEHQAVSR